MAFSVELFSYFYRRVAGNPIKMGSLSEPFHFNSSDDEVIGKFYTISNGSSAFLHSDPFDPFDLVVIRTDYNTSARLYYSDGTDNYIGIRGTGTALELGLPLILPRKVVESGGTTLDSVKIYNASGCTCTVIAYTFSGE